MTFNVSSPPVITIQSPLNQSYSTSSIWANVTLNKAGSSCIAQLDSATNYTMTNSTGNWNYQLTSLTTGNHNVKYYCNSSMNVVNTTTRYFYVDVSAPLWQNQGTNDTDNLIPQGGAINLTAQGKDETALDWAWLSTNESGSWVNYTNIINNETLRPNANSAITLSQSPASGSNYDKVDETSTDEDTTYVYTSSAGITYDWYELPNHTKTGTINSIIVSARGRNTVGAGAGLSIGIKTHGVTYSQDIWYGGMPTSYTTGSATWNTNPNTGQPWTWDEIDNLTVGVGLWDQNTPSGQSRCTQLYVDVNYTSGYYNSPMDMNNAVNNWQWSNFTWTNSSVTEGTIVGWKIYYNDTSNNTNVTNINTFRIRDTTPPKWYSNNTSPLSPATYFPNQNYQFNITFNDSFGMSDIILEFNSQNYSYLLGQLSNSGQVYYKTITDLSANTTGYTYRWYGNDTSNNWNSTTSLVYVINQNTSTSNYMNLTLNGIESNLTATYPNTTNATGWNSISQLTFTLYRNTTSIGTTNPISDNLQLGVGIYNYTYYTAGNANYSSATKQFNLTVNQNQTNPVDIFLNNGTAYQNQNITIAYGTETTANVTAVYTSSGTVSLFEDSSSVSNPRTTTLSV